MRLYLVWGEYQLMVDGKERWVRFYQELDTANGLHAMLGEMKRNPTMYRGVKFGGPFMVTEWEPE